MTCPSHHPRVPLSLLACLSLCSGVSAQVPSQTSLGAHTFDRWGQTVAVVGDVDADGYDDWAVGSPEADYEVFFPLPLLLPDVGRVFVHSGRTGGLLHAWTGPVSGDSEFGYAVTGAGDVDGDGHDDVLVGAPAGHGPFARSGFVKLYSGDTGALMRTIYGTQTDARFGHALDAGLDADGDFVPDMLVGSPHESLGGSQGGPGESGNVRLVSLATGAYLWADDWTATANTYPCTAYLCIESIDAIEHGAAVAMLGDRDNDGAIEIASGAPGSDYLDQYKPSPFGSFVTKSQKSATGVLRVQEPFGDLEELRYEEVSNQRRGESVAALGGLLPTNGLALAVGMTGGNGAVEILGVTQDVDHYRTFHGSAAKPVGGQVSGLGDVDGDGVVDLLVGHPSANVGTFNPIQGAGQASVYSTYSGALLAGYHGGEAFGFLGSAVAGGDLDDDGKPDVVLGAPGMNGTSADVGAAYVFPGHGCVAQAVSYGSAWPGTLGEPTLTGNGDPALGSAFSVELSNSLGATTSAFLLLGLNSANIPAKDGVVWVDALVTLAFAIPAGSSTLDLPIPGDDVLCGARLYLQAIEADHGASKGASFTKGLRLELGY